MGATLRRCVIEQVTYHTGITIEHNSGVFDSLFAFSRIGHQPKTLTLD